MENKKLFIKEQLKKRIEQIINENPNQYKGLQIHINSGSHFTEQAAEVSLYVLGQCYTQEQFETRHK